jgi:hypothetical protein
VVRGTEVFGTGFFVAPGQIVTCAHVVLDLGAKEGSRVDVRWGKVTISGIAEKIGLAGPVDAAAADGRSDLALVRCEPGPFSLEVAPPCVLLSEELPSLKDRRPIYAFGHAAGEYQENGESLTLRYDGPSFDAMNSPVLTFADGNVREGMSGAPVLDLGSGSVCGALFVSRGTTTAMGGRAIPARLIFDMFADLRSEHDSYHLQHGRWKSLWSRHSGGWPAVAPADPLPVRSPRRHYLEEETKFRVSAREFRVEKRRDSFGNSSVTYRIEGLRSDEDLRGLRWCFRSTIGIISSPSLTEGDETLVKWDPVSPHREEVLEVPRKLDEMRRLEGVFRFARRLKAGSEISFSWTVEILNQYALSDWEFENLYRELLHVDGSRIVRPMEFFPNVVWFPVRKIAISLSLPPGLNTRPSLRVFQHSSKNAIDRQDVLSSNIADAAPGLASAWNEREKWVEDEIAGHRMTSKLVPDPERPSSWLLEVDEPEVGTCLSLEWPLPTTFLMVVRSAEEIRRNLVSHGAQQRLKRPDAKSRAVHRSFRSFAETVRKRYGMPAGEERFEVTLMTYDERIRQVVVADGLLNGVDMEPKDWEFAVPFGVGLAGACFREGSQAMLWVRKERALQRHFDSYLEFSEKDRHEVLLVVPIDHPGLAEVERWHDWEAGMSLRSQQLLGVVTIASDSSDSRLLSLSTNSALDQEAEDSAPELIKDAMDRLAQIRIETSEMGRNLASHYGWSR